MVFWHIMAITSYTKELTTAQANHLQEILASEHYEFLTKPYALYAARKNKLSVTVYEKGPKVLVQGKETADFVSFTLEPQVLGEAALGYEENTNPDWFEPHFGIDESGKGDALGPLTIAGVYSNDAVTRELLEIGAVDSKVIKSRQKIAQLAERIRKIPGLQWELLVLEPVKYNELYSRFGNLNAMLAWGHATVIENLLRKQTDCPTALSDQFANPRVLANALSKKGVNIDLKQRVRAESDPAVAAASILARDAFVGWMEKNGKILKERLPLGSGKLTKEFIEKNKKTLEFVNYGKLHFKNFAHLPR